MQASPPPPPLRLHQSWLRQAFSKTFIPSPITQLRLMFQGIGIKSFYSNTSYGYEYKENCVS